MPCPPAFIITKIKRLSMMAKKFSLFREPSFPRAESGFAPTVFVGSTAQQVYFSACKASPCFSKNRRSRKLPSVFFSVEQYHRKIIKMPVLSPPASCPYCFPSFCFFRKTALALGDSDFSSLFLCSSLSFVCSWHLRMSLPEDLFHKKMARSPRHLSRPPQKRTPL